MPKVRLKPGDFAVLTLTEPWATLVVRGEKDWETRGWSTSHRGLLLIQAAKTMPRYAQQTCLGEPFESVLDRHGVSTPDCRPEDLGTARTQKLFSFAFGAIIGAVELTDTCAADTIATLLKKMGTLRARQELAFGDFAFGRWALRMARPRHFEHPIPVRGSLGIWTLDHDSEAAELVRGQIGPRVVQS